MSKSMGNDIFPHTNYAKLVNTLLSLNFYALFNIDGVRRL